VWPIPVNEPSRQAIEESREEMVNLTGSSAPEERLEAGEGKVVAIDGNKELKLRPRSDRKHRDKPQRKDNGIFDESHEEKPHLRDRASKAVFTALLHYSISCRASLRRRRTIAAFFWPVLAANKESLR